MLNGAIMGGVALTVELDAQDSVGWIGSEVDAGLHETADEAACVVVTAHGLAHALHQRALGAVGDEFDGVDEEFAPGAQLLYALLGRQVFEFDVLGVRFALGFALGFEGGEGLRALLEEGEQLAFALFVPGGFFGVVVLGAEAVLGEGGALAIEDGVLAAHLAFQPSPCGVDQPCGIRQRAGAVLDEAV